MNRRDFIRTGFMSAAAVGIGGAISSCQRRPEKPNIIYILADDLGYGDLSCYGQKRFETENIDRLATEGIRFTRHYSGSTVCAPSRCALMTGKHTGHCEIRGNLGVKPEGETPISAQALTVAEIAKQAGYVTGAFGKWGLGFPGSEGDPVHQGFDHFFGYNGQVQAHYYYPTHLWRNDEKVYIMENRNNQKAIYSQDLIMDEALNFVHDYHQQPFFLYLPFTIPHAELAVPEDSLVEFKGRFPETPFAGGHYGAQDHPHAAFAAMVTRMDRDIGRLMTLLQKLDLDRRTLVIFTSDNGPHLEGGHDPDFFDSNGPFRGYKRDLYEGGIRVPMLARWPGVIEPGRVSDHVSAFWDFLPTVCQLVDRPVPEDTDGISFAPELLGERQPEHEVLYWEFHEQGGKRAVRWERWKAVQLDVDAHPEGPVELYDLKNDMAEQTDIAAQHPELVEKARRLFEQQRTPSPRFPFGPKAENSA